MEFKKVYPFDNRVEFSSKILAKHPNHVPVIIQGHGDIVIYKQRYLVPKETVMSQFLMGIRNERFMKLDSTQAVYMFINNNLVPLSSMIIDIYKRHKDEDGFLYIYIAKEAAFG